MKEEVEKLLRTKWWKKRMNEMRVMKVEMAHTKGEHIHPKNKVKEHDEILTTCNKENE